MPLQLPLTCEAKTMDLVYIWTVLESLTVSFDRIGAFEAIHGHELGKEALSQYIEPVLNERIAEARARMVSILETSNPAWADELERLSDDETTIGYWQHLKRM